MRFHEVNHGVYFDDLDIFGVLHNARHPLLVERTIGDFWKKMGWGSIARLRDSPDQFHLVRANHFEYERAVEGVDEVRVRVWVQKLGKTSLTFGFSVLPIDEDTPYCTGYRVLVCVDSSERQPRSWSVDFRQKLQPYRADLEDS
jgi:acyl-CoA thioester hydrolase